MDVLALLWQILWGGGLLFATLLAILWWNQEGMLYIPAIPGLPDKTPSGNPAGYKLPSEHRLPFEEVWLNTSDGETLHCWFIKHAHPASVPTIVFYHANAGNIGLRLPNVKRMYDELGCNIFMVDYRGYGRSSGVPSERGLRIDGQTALDHVLARKDIDNKRVVVFGRSLGGAVALRVLHDNQDKLAGGIVENTFQSIPHMVDHMFGVIARFKWLILRLDWNTHSLMPKIHKPILFLSSPRDEIVPPPQMKGLYEAATGCKGHVFKLFPDGMHNDLWEVGGQAYYNYMADFLSTITKS